MKSGNRGRPVPNPTGEPEDEVAEHVYAARLAGGFHFVKKRLDQQKKERIECVDYLHLNQ